MKLHEFVAAISDEQEPNQYQALDVLDRMSKADFVELVADMAAKCADTKRVVVRKGFQ